jgi:D-glucosaminate-6-phosphate ammonia-lyase
MARMSVYDALGVRRVVNACGIYTDLGGSVLGLAAWAAAAEANATWAAMDELLDASGARIAALCGAEAARVVPGASAGIALAIGAGIARGDGAVMEALPHTDAVVLMQRGHEYKYARCATLAGARVEWTDDIVAALDTGAAAILHPAHLDGVAGTVALDSLAPLARAAGVAVVVDAAYQSFPLSELERWSTAADAACFSAKYFWGPNGGGFIAGRTHYVSEIAALDFTGYESGHWRTFGRAFKLDRATVAATVAALEAWTELDHDARLAGYASLAGVLAERCGGAPGGACGSQTVHARRAAGRRTDQRGTRARWRSGGTGRRAGRRRTQHPCDGRRRRARVLHRDPDRSRSGRDRGGADGGVASLNDG